MQVGIVTFPGSNCDHDVYHVVKHVCGADAAYVWHKDRLPGGLDAVVVPGGFSYGDYLRCGALARFSPVMEDVVAFAKGGGPVLGICNGFQILCESGLLPGVLMRNASLKFICRDVTLKVDGEATPATRGLAGQALTMPIAHAEGNYFADQETLDRLEGEGRVAFRYVGGAPNGAARDIAGISGGPRRNVVGLMPHPERAAEPILGRDDGRRLFEAPTHPTFAATVCHPHPALGGTMHNHATYRLAKAVVAKGGVALRFNTRGTGRSAGAYDGGRGEADDLRAALAWLAANRAGLPILACGFSFGAWLTVGAGGEDPGVEGLLLAGVALRAEGLEDFRRSGRIRELAKPVAIVQAEQDPLGPPAEVEAAIAGSRGPRRFAVVPGATHLFTEDLPALQREAEAALDWLLGAP